MNRSHWGGWIIAPAGGKREAAPLSPPPGATVQERLRGASADQETRDGESYDAAEQGPVSAEAKPGDPCASGAPGGHRTATEPGEVPARPDGTVPPAVRALQAGETHAGPESGIDEQGAVTSDVSDAATRPNASSEARTPRTTNEAVTSSEAKASSEAQRPFVCTAPTLYFAGDSGYFQGFREIGRRHKIDVALMPIGAYEPEYFMSPQHVTPEQALQAFLDTGATWFVPMHYGSFKLADDTPREALDRLESGRRAHAIEETRVVILPHGETWRLSGE
ncbi:hypothetical protein IDH44_21805 [Paenibacillus sp. IB182496]|uniref:Metallo-beta-lactamase domain-containing protein n=2 Tax=Paenibacillus sabuli TaxID=2772509 RepID=A0A927BYV9_9BACL|nr:hypothetical protein [Paenibacillus sabuli]